MKIALATGSQWPGLHPEEEALPAKLAQRGVEAHVCVWNDPAVRWESYDSVVVRSTWDYHYAIDAFSDWLDRLEELGRPTWNPLPLLRMSVDKNYLVDIARAGFDTVPSIVVSADDPDEIEGLFDDLGCEEAVIKPTVAASGFRTHLLQRGNRRQAMQHYRELLSYGDVLVQPYVDTVRELGEWSLVYLDGQFSHGLLKRPAEGDFRVQEEHGGRTERADVPAFVRQSADALIDWLDQPTLYARVDGFARQGDRWLISELELLEPLLFLDHQPGSLDRFADAIARRVQGESR
jgi:glutathione synthase/RimK-type ligase-like ATP-grasp enzyme